jgi:hypothetical protein
MAKVQFTDFRASVKSALRREKLEGQLADTSSGTARKDIGKVPYFQPHDSRRRGPQLSGGIRVLPRAGKMPRDWRPPG